MACSANHSKGSGHGSQQGSGLIVGPNAWLQRKVHLRPQHRGVHLVTEEILRGVSRLDRENKSSFTGQITFVFVIVLFVGGWLVLLMLCAVW